MPEDPICVIATSVHEGHMFAERLGLQNYEIYSSMMARGMVGKRFREIVVTTEFIFNLLDTQHHATNHLYTARYSMQKRADGPNY